MRLQQRGRVVQEDPRRAELGQAPAGLDERLVPAAAVEQPGVELAVGADDRLGGLLQVLDVVQRVVQAEDVDAALGGAGDEPPREVAVDRPRADEEAAAQGERERRRRARLQRADALPRALDAAAHGGVEDAAARDLEVGETRRRPGSRRPRSRSAVGIRPASGSCESTRIDVSTRRGTAWDLTLPSPEGPESPRFRQSALTHSGRTETLAGDGAARRNADEFRDERSRSEPVSSCWSTWPRALAPGEPVRLLVILRLGGFEEFAGRYGNGATEKLLEPSSSAACPPASGPSSFYYRPRKDELCGLDRRAASTASRQR